MESTNLQTSKRYALTEAFLGPVSQRTPSRGTTQAVVHTVATTHLAAATAAEGAVLPDIGTFYDQLAEKGGINALNEEDRSAGCQRLLKQLEGVDFQKTPNYFLNKFILTIEKMIYWREHLLIRGQTQRIFELFFKFCKNPQLYGRLSGDSLTKMVNILGTAAVEGCPPRWVDRILKDLNPELHRLSKANKQWNSWVLGTIIGMSKLGCFTPERERMFKTLIPEIASTRPLTWELKGFYRVKEAFWSFVESTEHLETTERANFVGVVKLILENWSESMRANKTYLQRSPK